MGSVLTKVTSPTSTHSTQLLPSLVQIIFGALYKTSILVSDSVSFKLTLPQLLEILRLQFELGCTKVQLVQTI